MHLTKQPHVRWFSLIILAGILHYINPASVSAKTVGRIQGIVLDSLIGRPLSNARIKVKDRSQWAISDSLGRFSLFHIPVGMQTLVIKKDGYHNKQYHNVLVLPGEPVWKTLLLSPVVAKVAEVVITSSTFDDKQGMMEKTTHFSKEAISRLPYQDAYTVAGLSSGVISDSRDPELFYVRGGRLGEAAIYFDGILQNSPLDYTVPMNFDARWMEEIVLKSGFNARYGNALSGVMHIMTKSPSEDQYIGVIDALTDAGGYGARKLSAVFSGPIYPSFKTLSFLGSINVERTGDASPAFGFSERDGAGFEQRQAFLKMAYRPNQNSSLTLGALYHFGNQDLFSVKRSYNRHAKMVTNSQGDITGYSFFNENSSENSGRKETNVRQAYLRFNRLLSSNLFLTAQANYYDETQEVGDNRFWRDFERYRENVSIGTDAFGLVNLPGNPYGAYWRESVSYLGGRLDLEGFWNEHNLQMGGFFRTYSLKIAEFQPEVLPDNDPTLNIVGYDPSDIGSPALDEFLALHPDWRNPETDGVQHPFLAGMYLQDHLYKDNFGLNVGFRLDYFDPNTLTIKDLKHPFIEGTSALNYTRSSARLEFQPRVSLKLLVSKGLMFHAHLGRYAQMPPLRFMFAGDALMKRYMQGGRGLRLMSAPNPNLKPEKTTTYEIGMQLEPYAGLWFDITMFYKQTRDLIQTVFLEPLEDGSLPGRYIYGNADFGTIKGLELSFETQRWQHVKLRGTYTLQYATGTNTTPDELFDFLRRFSPDYDSQLVSDAIPNTVHPLDFDRRHVAKFNADVQLKEQLNLSFMYQVMSGVVYTPRALSYDPVTDLTSPELISTATKNAESASWHHQLDMKLSKAFQLGHGPYVTVYLIGINILNIKNERRVYETTGEAGKAGFSGTPEFSERIEGFVQRIQDPQIQVAQRPAIEKAYRDHYHEQERNPDHFGPARQFKLGISVSF